MEKRRRYALLLCAEDSDYVKKVHGGYFQVFVRLLGDEEDEWDLFRATSGELPRGDNEIAMYDGFIITGSCNDAHGDDLWIGDLVRLLKRLDSLEKKVLGICFGHQILCRALGGKTGRAKKGWDIGLTTIHLSSSTKYLPSPNTQTSLSVIECHRDEVWEIPPKAEVVAWSEKTGVEMFRKADHIMGIQGHPEYTKDILLHLIDRLLQRNLIQGMLCFSCHLLGHPSHAPCFHLSQHKPKHYSCHIQITPTSDTMPLQQGACGKNHKL